MPFSGDRPSEREVRHRLKITGIHVASLMVGLALGVFTVGAQVREMPPWIIAAVAILVSGFSLWITVYWWRQIDEAARAAHLHAFFWGGLTGMAVALAMAVTVYASREAIDVSGSAASWFAYGAFAAFLCMVAGYGIAWAAWWLKRR